MQPGDRVKINEIYSLLEDESFAFFGKTGEILQKSVDFDDRWVVKLDKSVGLKGVGNSREWDFKETDLELI